MLLTCPTCAIGVSISRSAFKAFSTDTALLCKSCGATAYIAQWASATKEDHIRSTHNYHRKSQVELAPKPPTAVAHREKSFYAGERFGDGSPTARPVEPAEAPRRSLNNWSFNLPNEQQRAAISGILGVLLFASLYLAGKRDVERGPNSEPDSTAIIYVGRERLTATLRDPDSLQIIEERIIKPGLRGGEVGYFAKFRAKNGFGGYMVEEYYTE